MAKPPRPEQRQPGETPAEHHQRTEPWNHMIRLGTEMKTVRSRIKTAIDNLQHADQYNQIPASQQQTVAQWGGVLVEMLNRLDQLDVDAWKPGMRAEIARHETSGSGEARRG